MNAYDVRYEIRLANKSDIDSIMKFIDKYWKKNHIMSRNRELFEYEFLEDDGTVNFLLAIDRKNGLIQALNGILKASHDTEHLDIFGSFWKALDGNMAFLGIELIKRKNELYGARTAIGVGDNPDTSVPLMKMLHRYTSKMKHYYMLSDMNDFQIAQIAYRPEIRYKHTHDYSIVKYENIDEVKRAFDAIKYVNNIPYKDFWYIDHRFFQHPIYHYDVYGIEKENKAEAVFVLRKEIYNNHCAIRFVDYIGTQEVISETGDFFRHILKEKNIEYVDFYCDGIKEEYLMDAGFALLQEKDTNIIPNYFSPYIKENIDIYVSSTKQGTVFTKADADQDRPN